MLWKLSQLREKDVIDVCSGRRIGYLSDLELCPDGRVTAVFVSPRFLGRGGERIPWDKIVCLGEDALLVRMPESWKPGSGAGGGLFGKICK